MLIKKKEINKKWRSLKKSKLRTKQFLQLSVKQHLKYF